MSDENLNRNTGAEYNTTAADLRAEAERMLDVGVATVRLDHRSRGWSPLNPGGKSATPPLIRSDADAKRLLRAGDNLGHWLEGGLVQIDADWPEVGETLLLRLGLKQGLPYWGRRSKNVSGMLARSPDLGNCSPLCGSVTQA